jgi:transmembrane sensor
MKKQQFISILDKYLKNQATAEEQNLLYAYYHLFMADDDVLLLLKDEEKEKLKLQIKAGIHARIGEIEADIAPEQLRRVKLWPRIAVASRRKVGTSLLATAAAVTAITLGVWLYSNKYRDASVKTGSTASVNDIAPGKNGATITLANGKVIQLSDAKSGVVIGEDDLKYSDGSDVRYSSAELQGADGKVQNLIAATAKGQTYQFTLSDGTKVWLNADSKIYFPSQFSGKERKILLEGEGYFEVVQDKAHPFLVRTDKQEVEVLGTHFNISAYQDGAIKTTLLEGSVKVNGLERAGGVIRIGFSEVLKPNQQAVLSGNKLDVITANTDQVIAWKNGKFAFNKQSLQEIMRGIARWYNVEVVFEPGFVSRPFTGSISRFENISTVLRVLELTGTVHFRVEGRRVTVMQ